MYLVVCFNLLTITFNRTNSSSPENFIPDLFPSYWSVQIITSHFQINLHAHAQRNYGSNLFRYVRKYELFRSVFVILKAPSGQIYSPASKALLEYLYSVTYVNQFKWKNNNLERMAVARRCGQWLHRFLYFLGCWEIEFRFPEGCPKVRWNTPNEMAVGDACTRLLSTSGPYWEAAFQSHLHFLRLAIFHTLFHLFLPRKHLLLSFCSILSILFIAFVPPTLSPPVPIFNRGIRLFQALFRLASIHSIFPVGKLLFFSFPHYASLPRNASAPFPRVECIMILAGILSDAQSMLSGAGTWFAPRHFRSTPRVN